MLAVIFPLFVIIFSLGQMRWKELLQRQTVVWCPRVESPRGLILSFNLETKAKVLVEELEQGKEGNNGGMGLLSEAEKNKSSFTGFADEERLCLYYHVDFSSPNNHVFSPCFDPRQFSTDDSGALQFGSLSGVTCFIVTAAVKNSSSRRCLACSRRWAPHN